MSTEEFIREYGRSTFRIVKKGHQTLQRLWYKFPTVKDLVSARPSEICYYRGEKISQGWIISLEQLLEKHNLYFGCLPPKKV
ncbi:MAG: hypothetical protein QG585_598 [Patescibacteria group bacterium]|nr:hypothetical protein [Patescibacteria group bacterium]